MLFACCLLVVAYVHGTADLSLFQSEIQEGTFPLAIQYSKNLHLHVEKKRLLSCAVVFKYIFVALLWSIVV